MPAAQRMIGRFDLVHPAQYIVEGIGAANYARNLNANSAMVAPFQKGVLVSAPSPQYEDNFYAGEFDRKGSFRVWEDCTITVTGRVLNNNTGLGLMDWAFNAPTLNQAAGQADNDASRNPNQSRTWLQSYLNAKGKIVYQVCKGCKVQSAKLTFSNKGIAMIEIVMDCKRYYEITSADTAGAVNTTALTVANSGLDTASGKVDLVLDETDAQPLIFAELGDFIYKPRGTASAGASGIAGTNIPFRDLELSVDYTLRKQDSNGSFRNLFVDHAGRSGSGSISAFKAGSELNEDARLDNQHVAYFQLEKETTSKKDTAAKIQVNSASSKELDLYAAVPGAAGNGVKIEFKAAASAASVTTSGKKITVVPKTGELTYANLMTLVNSDKFASKVGQLGAKDSTGVISGAIAEKTTVGGVDKVRKLIFQNFKFDVSSENLLEQSEATIESKGFSADTVISKGKI